MTTVAGVRLWGTRIGAVALEDGESTAFFEYDPDFIRSGIQVAPITMPIERKIYRFPALSRETFHGLPGLLADSLPDRFGTAIIDTWLASQGRNPESFNAVERLCYTGARGMGALEFEPSRGPQPRKATQIQVDQLVTLASEILAQRGNLRASFADEDKSEAMRDILRIGTSAGGARAKAVIAWNPETQEVRSGQVEADDGFEYWLIKFDGVSGNKDKEIDDPRGFGAIEYAYAQMARDAGIRMSDCDLLEEQGRRHFMTRRFDRLPGGDKLHMQSLCAMGHYDFNLAGANSYEQALMLIRQLGLPMVDLEEMYRRMAFNVIGRNQDDHVKNIAFLMDRQGQWSLAPAFDVTYSYNPSGRWTSQHQMTLAGKREGFDLDDFKAVAASCSMKRGRAETILGEVRAVIGKWRDYADEAKVEIGHRDLIHGSLRLDPFH
jgi:serine/threonine-protein kinase HipA